MGQIGLIDRLSGAVESRFVVPETEKVVAWGRGEIAVATQHKQVITYSFKPNGIDSAVNNQALGDQHKIESYTKVGKS
jgi:hypothetical protein